MATAWERVGGLTTPQSATPGEGTDTMRTLGIDIAWQLVLCGLYRGMFCAEHFGSHFLPIVAHFDVPILE